MTARDDIFSQNDMASSVVLILRGNIDVHLEYDRDETFADIAAAEGGIGGDATNNDIIQSSDGSKKGTVSGAPSSTAAPPTVVTPASALRSSEFLVGKLSGFSALGCIDFLFQHKNHSIRSQLEDILYPINYSRVPDLVGLSRSHGDTTAMLPEAAASLVAEVPSKLGGLVADLDRSVAPGMFATYSLQNLCELLIVEERQVERLLLPIMFSALKKRLQVISACGIFNAWSREDHIRLARMGMVRAVACK